MAIGRTNAGGGGGGSGATLTITGVAGATVTASKDGKTYTRTINSSGSAVFKGLSTGTWIITMSGNGQTTTRTVEITADYSLTIAFFSATISITYPAASTCVVTDSTGATVASDTNADSAAKTWTATVDASGTYTVTATATDGSGKTKSTTVSITTDGQAATVVLTYELILFNGTDNTSATGGWTFGEWASGGSEFSDATISNNQIVYSQSSYGGIFTKKQIDVTDYKTLYCECTITGYLEYANSFGISKSTNQAIVDSGMDMNSKFVARKALAAGTYTGSNALSVDISKITGNCSLGFGVFCSNTLTIKINKVWLV